VTWRHDPEAAERYARAHFRRWAPGCAHQLACRCEAPHHLRCDFVDGAGARCAQLVGHLGEHVAPREAA